MSAMINLIYRRRSLSPEQESEICRKCQFCCRWIGFKVPLGSRNGGYFAFIHEWGIPSSVKGDTVSFYVPLPCKHIRDKSGCNIYENRPVICKNHRGGDTDAAIIPYCGWYESVPDEERFQVLKGIEWSDIPKEQK